jgi:hypothetical protein
MVSSGHCSSSILQDTKQAGRACKSSRCFNFVQELRDHSSKPVKKAASRAIS